MQGVIDYTHGISAVDSHLVHPLGARHMVNPAKLIEGTIGVYGEAETRQAGANRHRRLKRALRSLVLEEARRHHWRLSPERLLEIFRVDFELNAQGLGIWLDAQPK